MRFGKLALAMSLVAASVVGLAQPALAHDAVSFGASTFRVVEGSTAFIRVNRCCHETFKTSVRVSTRPLLPTGTDAPVAEEGTDFTAASRVISFSSPVESDDFMVQIPEDDAVEEPEFFEVYFSDPGLGTALAFPRVARVMIVDNDGPSRISLGQPTYTIFENRLLLDLEVVRSGSVAEPASAAYSTEDGVSEKGYGEAAAGVDYRSKAGVVTFTSGPAPTSGAGARFATVQLRAEDDKLNEGDESFFVALSDPSGAVLGSPERAEVVILDDEAGGSDQIHPLTAFHVPLEGKTYKRSALRELWVFNQDDPDGSGVKTVRVAIRKKFRDGSCKWWNGKGFKSRFGKCHPGWAMWVKKRGNDDVVFFRLPRPLQRTVGTRVRNYQAYSQGIDRVGNREERFTRRQNLVKFKVR